MFANGQNLEKQKGLEVPKGTWVLLSALSEFPASLYFPKFTKAFNLLLLQIRKERPTEMK